MTEQPSSTTERFLQQLAGGLEALGPAETQEVLAEIRSHLAEATAEGGESAALARFGSPDVLATRILEERGVLAGGSAAQRAPGWSRLTALAVDIALWLFLLWVLVTPVAFLGFAGPIHPLYTALAWAYLAVVVGASAWWWVRGRRRGGHITNGMKVMGLRRVRTGPTTRIVRSRDIPGLARDGLGAVARVAGALSIVLILAWFGYSTASSVMASHELNHQQEINSAVRDALQAESLVRDVYDGVMAGSSMQDRFTPDAREALVELKARRAAGSVDFYNIVNAELPDYDWSSFPSDNASAAAYELVVLVDVQEVASDAAVTYRYRVVTTCENYSFDGNGGFAGFGTLIRSVDLVEHYRPC